MDLERVATLFDLSRDPDETDNLADVKGDQRRRMRTAILDRDAAAAKVRAAIPAQDVAMDAARRAQLQALGYVE
jgi:hypothetical protein